MKIFIDENIPRMTAKALLDLGHDVKDIRGTVDQGIDDTSVWATSQQEKRLLITTDSGKALW